MSTRRASLTAGAVGLAALLGACGGSSNPAEDDPEVAEAIAALDTVPSQEEADAEADALITEDNADAEFEKLTKEIDSDN